MIVHQAGEMAHGKQRCVRCGFVLTDGDQDLIAKQMGWPIWPIGAAVAVQEYADRTTFSRRPEDLDAGQPCYQAACD